MKTNHILPVIACVVGLVLSACTLNKAEASAVYIAAETGTAALINKNPQVIPVINLLVADWAKLQNGTIVPSDEVTLLQSIVTVTKAKLNPTEAAALDGAVQQVLANQNATAPTPLQGAAGAIITTVINGAARAVAIYQAPAAPASVGK
jgi:hypothetical protein